MFDEVPFDEELSGQDGGPRPAPSSSNAEGAAQVVERFHRPGEPQFCAIAGAQHDTQGFFDSRTMNGDSWVSSDCRCGRCESLRFIVRTRDTRSTPLVVVLLDLDNFGFNQLKSVAPAVDPQQGVDILDHIFVWAFFGSCFARHHRQWPTEETVTALLPNMTSTRQTIWQRLVAQRRVLFTPCSGHNQGADGVIADVLPMVAGRYPTILVTGDKALLRQFAPPTRPVGRKSKRENEEDVLARRLSLLDVDEIDKRFVPFWRLLTRLVTSAVEDHDEYA